MTAIEQAYASNAETPLLTVELLHSSFGSIRLVSARYDLEATLEDSTTVTFLKSGVNIVRPEKSTDGRQDLAIEIDNYSNIAWNQIKQVITANRVSDEAVICKFRSFLESDLSAPAGGVFVLTVTQTSINISTVSIKASYTPIPDTNYPRHRYYATTYPGLKYV